MYQFFVVIAYSHDTTPSFEKELEKLNIFIWMCAKILPGLFPAKTEIVFSSFGQHRYLIIDARRDVLLPPVSSAPLPPPPRH